MVSGRMPLILNECSTVRSTWPNRHSWIRVTATTSTTSADSSAGRSSASSWLSWLCFAFFRCWSWSLWSYSAGRARTAHRALGDRSLAETDVGPHRRVEAEGTPVSQGASDRHDLGALVQRQ